MIIVSLCSGSFGFLVAAYLVWFFFVPYIISNFVWNVLIKIHAWETKWNSNVFSLLDVLLLQKILPIKRFNFVRRHTCTGTNTCFLNLILHADIQLCLSFLQFLLIWLFLGANIGKGRARGTSFPGNGCCHTSFQTDLWIIWEWGWL